jgi:hypothetical protein
MSGTDVPGSGQKLPSGQPTLRHAKVRPARWLRRLVSDEFAVLNVTASTIIMLN